MSHTIVHKKKLLDRVSRIRGQLDAVRRGLEGEGDHDELLQTIAACRGAMDALLAQVIEGHIEEHSHDRRSNKALIKVIRAYLK